ncbi:MAG: fibronectin type III domain-containing protein, partial [Planctomycetaceae bacterium]|nr:fibronectin type III domain-containing protein [Planctomycetaceae bacterium]
MEVYNDLVARGSGLEFNWNNDGFITYIYAYASGLEGALDVSGLTGLTRLWIHNHRLTSLDISNCTALTELLVDSSQLTSLDVSTNTALNEFDWLFSARDNQLTFSTLLLPANDRSYSIGNQQPVQITLTAGNAVDISSEYLIEGEYITQYTWFYSNGDVVDSSLYTESNGIFTFSGIQDGSIIYCTMTNDRFPGWTLETTEVMISETSNPLVPPATPTGLASTSRTTDSIALSWNVVANATGYEIQYRTGSEAWRSESVTETSATIAFLDSNTTYEFQVRAVNDDGASEWSSIISIMTDTIELGTPTLMSAVAIGHDTLTIFWEAASNASAYRVEYSRSPIFAGTSESVMIYTIDGTLATTTNLTGLLANTTYYIRTIALSGNNISERSNILHTNTDAKQLTTPIISSISVSGTTSLKVEWSTVQHADGYMITYFTGEGNAPQTIFFSSNATSAVIAGLQTGQEYTISITAIGTGEYINSANSDVMLGTPTVQHNVPVAVNPSGVKMMNAKSAYPPTLNSVSLEWRANAANVAYFITQNGTPIPAERITYITNAQSQIVGATITGLESGTRYNFTVAAYNANNEKAQRDITVRATTLAENRAIVKSRAISHVRGIDGTGPTINTVQISWNILT